MKRLAKAGGSRPEAAQRQRRSRLAISRAAGAYACPGAILAILWGICLATGRGSHWVRDLSAVVCSARQSPRLDVRGQRLGFGLAHISLGIGVPQCERHGRQRGTRRILRLLFEDDTVIVEAMRKGSNATGFLNGKLSWEITRRIPNQCFSTTSPDGACVIVMR